MSQEICIHGHFYQPPRENPWLEEVEFQDSAKPYHDWNERITDECYAPNTASRILDSERRIIDVVDNYSRMSFNFGPTLLSWMEDHAPDVYQSILESDKESQEKFSGHGSAIAQAYNHMIMPLANEKDKRTQVVWGLRDFKERFERDPEGMWLPETAVDLETLDIMAEYGIKFTILAPRQAKRVRKIGEEEWKDVSEEKVDPRRPYLCNLKSGRSIVIFFYNGPISKDVGFGDLIHNGEKFAERLIGSFSEGDTDSQIVNIATDGETYGHHHRFGDMTLARCLYKIESSDNAELTVYGKYLEENPPEYEVEIFENTSWSCVHGVERWKDDCGCNSGSNPDWNQKWRKPLRKAMNQLRDSLASIYEKNADYFLKDPWEARNDYIDVVLDRSSENVRAYLSKHSKKDLSPEETVKVLKLLEMQRNSMLMFTSCGWFFDEISGEEAVQVMRYAARAMQLAQDLNGSNLESEYLKILEQAPSNVQKYKNGVEVFEDLVKSSVVDFPRVCAHYAVSSLFEDYPDKTVIDCFNLDREIYELENVGDQKLAVGKVGVRSNITWEERSLAFAVLYMGDHNIIGGVLENFENEYFEEIKGRVKKSFQKSNISETFHVIDENFGENNYSLWHLFRDEQRKVLKQILEPKIKETEKILHERYQDFYPTIRAIREIQYPMPKIIKRIGDFVLNLDLRNLLRREDLDLGELQELVVEIKIGSFEVDKTMIGYEATRKVNELMDKLSQNPEDTYILKKVENILEILLDLDLDLNFWKAQNAYFSVGKAIYHKMKDRADQDKDAERWIETFDKLGNYLNVKIS